MIRIVRQFFMWSFLLIGLTSCGTKETPPTMSPSGHMHKVKTLPPAPVVVSKPLPSELTLHKVGILLPLTGPQAGLGKGMLDAAEMALFEMGSSSVVLLPQDTTLGAHQAALNALDQGAELILGPIFASEVESIKPLLSSHNVNLISFSTDQSVAGKGAFVLGILPSQQIERVLSYAKEKGVVKIAALMPDDQYGQLIEQTLRQLESLGNVKLLGVIRYTKGDLLEGNPGNIRLVEEVDAFKKKGLEALLIPEGGENLINLLNFLSSLRPFKILGSGQWDSPQTIQAAEGLKEGYFASTNPQERQNFENRFQKEFGYRPPRIATLSYDATALAIALSDKGYTSKNLTFSQGFSGVDGLFRLTSDGLNERGLAIFEVMPTEFKMVSPAPQTF